QSTLAGGGTCPRRGDVAPSNQSRPPRLPLSDWFNRVRLWLLVLHENGPRFRRRTLVVILYGSEYRNSRRKRQQGIPDLGISISSPHRPVDGKNSRLFAAKFWCPEADAESRGFPV